jgi:hypothetical protein
MTESAKLLVELLGVPLFLGSWTVFTIGHMMSGTKGFAECAVDGFVGSVGVMFAFAAVVSLLP